MQKCVPSNLVPKIKNDVLRDYFKKLLREIAEEDGEIRLHFYKKKEAEGRHGYMDDSDPEETVINCRILTDECEWISTLVHEWCHYKQMKRRTPAWELYQSDQVHELFNPEISCTQRLYASRIYIALELECEGMTLEEIRKNGLPICPFQYSQEANIILFKYVVFGKYGLWPMESRWHKKKIRELMPDYLMRPNDYNIFKIKKEVKAIWGII